MNRQELEYYARKYGLTIIIILSLIAFLVPLLIRLWNGAPITPGAESYTLLRHAELLSNGNAGFDPLTARTFAPNPYDLLLSAFIVFGVPWALPLVLVIVLLIMLFVLMERYLQSIAVTILALATITLSPTMSVLGTTHTTTLLCLTLVAGAIIAEKRTALAVFLLFIAAMANPVVGSVCGLIIALTLIWLKQRSRATIAIVAIVTGVLWTVAWTWHAPLLGISKVPLLFEFGESAGISVFFILLIGYGIAVRPAFRMPSFLVSSILVLCVTLFMPAMIPITVILGSIIVGYAIIDLLTAPWDLALLQQALVTLIACIGIFLLIANVRERVTDTPDGSFAHTLINLKNQYREGGVLSAPEYAPMIEYFSGRRATSSVDPSIAFHSRDAKEVFPYLTETGTNYILITREMRESIFQRSDEGLLFLLEGSGRFVKIDEDEDTTLYYFIRT